LGWQIIVFLLVLFVWLAGSFPARAVPAAPDPFKLRQPDGSEITLRVFGDEWFHWYETMDGRPVTLDPATGFWMYSAPSETGPNVSSGRRAGIDAPVADAWKPRPPATLKSAPKGRSGQPRSVSVGSTGTGLVPVLLGNFSDTTPTVSITTMSNLLFSTAAGSNSMATFYTEVSYGKFTVSAGSSGLQDWLTVAHPASYYATNKVKSSATANDGPQADQFVRDVVVAAVAAGYDFSPYALPGTGRVPVVCVVHAGLGEENGGGPATIWSHRGSLSGSLGVNGPVTIQTSGGQVVVDDYIIEPEIQPQKLPATGVDVVGIGVFCHEYGHALGLPDLYDITYKSLGVGVWSVMGYGSYNSVLRAGDTPAHFDAWCKAKLGWVTPVDFTLNSANAQFPAAAKTPYAAKLWKDGQAGQEYFLVENRYTTGFDAGLPSSGLLVWHIDESKGGEISVWNKDNAETWYPISAGGRPADTNNGNYHVELMQADNLWQLNLTNASLQNAGDAGDPFPGSTGNRVFGPNTAPNSQAYNVGATPGYNSYVSVSNISDPGLVMTADLYTRSPNSGPFVEWVNIGGVVPPLSGSQFSQINAQNPVVIRALPGANGLPLNQAQLYITRLSDGLWWDFDTQQWTTNVLSSNYNMAASEQNGLTLAFVTGLPGGANLTDGGYLFTVRVIDSAGVPTQLQLAMTAAHAPNVVLSLQNNSVVNTLTNTFTAIATEDTGIGIERVEFALYWDSAPTEGGLPTRWFWGGNSWSTTPTWLGSDFPTHPAQATEYYGIGPDANNLLTEKQYTIQARAVDGQGDATTNTISVFYDPGSPGTIYWNYSANGDWFDPANWTPERTPLPTDNVVVNVPGDYTVTINGDVNVASLRFGRVVGLNVQRLVVQSGSLTLNGGDTNKVYANCELDLGGNLTAGVVQLFPGAAWNWTGGSIQSTVNVANAAIMTAEAANASGGTLVLGGLIQNAGTFNVAGGAVQLFGPAFGAGFFGEVINLPGALVDLQSDGSIINYSGEYFVNQGILRKSGGAGVSAITPIFVNSGVLDTESGTVSLTGGGSAVGAQFIGAGTSVFTAGTYALGGMDYSLNAVLGGAVLAGSNAFLSGNWTWTNGSVAPGSALTVATNSVLTLAGANGTDYVLSGVLTNAGTIRLVSGNLQLFGAAFGGGYDGELVNLPGAIVDFQSDVSIDDYSGEQFINAGVVRKSGGTGVSQIAPAFGNSGLLDVLSGSLNLAGGGNGNGQFVAEAGTSLNVSGGYEMDHASVTGAGTNVLTGGTFTIDGSLKTANVVLAGASLGGTNGVINTTVTWTSGFIAPGSTLTVATNGVLILAGANGNGYAACGILTNAGTIRLSSGDLQLYGPAFGAGYSGELVNLPGAVVDIQSDVSIANYSGEYFINQGTLRKSGGTGASQIKPIFDSTGAQVAQTGAISLVGGGSLDSASLTGLGTNLFTAGSYNLSGTINSSNAVLAGATLTSSNGVLAGSWVWASGSIAPGSVLMVAANGTLALEGANGVDYALSGILTNAGTIRLASGDLQLFGPAFGGGYSGELVNLPGGVVDFQADVSIDDYSGEQFINAGVVRKSGGTGVSQIHPSFSNTGLLDVKSGSIDLAGGGDGNGQFVAEAGTTLSVSGGYEMDNASVTGAGTNVLTGGVFTLDGNLKSANVVLAGAILGGTNGVIDTTVIWTSGSIAPGSTLTVATNGVLVLAGANGADYQLGGTLTNAGTVRLFSGNLQLVGPAFGNGYSGELVNLPGAVVDLQSDVSIDTYSGELFVNQGTLRKSGGTGASRINPFLENSGELDAQTGAISLVGSGSMVGARLTGAGTNMFSVGSYTLAGIVNSSNAVLGGAAVGGSNAVLAGLWSWTSGSIAPGSALTVATNGVLSLAGVDGNGYSIGGILTNAGTIRLISGSLQLFGPAFGAGYSGELVNLPGGLVDFQSDVSIDDYSGELFVNQGVARKSGGTGVSQISLEFDNTGVLDVQTGMLNLTGNTDLAGGDLNFGLNSPANYGQVALPAGAILAGAVSANLNGGYSPAAGDTFQVVTYSALNGAFVGFSLPGGITWQTNYGPGGFTLAVLNPAALSISAPPQSQTVQVGQDVTFDVTAAGISPFGYQWVFDGTNIAGANSPSLILTNVQLSDAGTYYVVVTNASGSITSSNAVLTVLSIPNAPQLTNLKSSGGSLSFSFVSQLGVTYVFEYKDALTDPVWTTLQTVPGTGGVLNLSDQESLSRTRFYRVGTQ
jgi:M6 family metalloprotease-like protein